MTQLPVLTPGPSNNAKPTPRPPINPLLASRFSREEVNDIRPRLGAVVQNLLSRVRWQELKDKDQHRLDELPVSGLLLNGAAAYEAASGGLVKENEHESR